MSIPPAVNSVSPLGFVSPPGLQFWNQAVANATVFTDSLFMRWPVEPNTQYIYEVMILHESGGGRFRYRVGMPAGTVMSSSAEGAEVVNTPDSTEFIVPPDPDMPHRGRGLIETGALAGLVFIQFTQAEPRNSPTVLKQGSWLRLTSLPLEAKPHTAPADARPWADPNHDVLADIRRVFSPHSVIPGDLEGGQK